MTFGKDVCWNRFVDKEPDGKHPIYVRNDERVSVYSIEEQCDEDGDPSFPTHIYDEWAYIYMPDAKNPKPCCHEWVKDIEKDLYVCIKCMESTNPGVISTTEVMIQELDQKIKYLEAQNKMVWDIITRIKQAIHVQ